MKTYETVIILDDRKVQDEGKAFSEEFASAISGAGGEMIKSTPLGRKTFAREIKKKKTGYYWVYTFDAAEETAKELPEKYKLEDRVLRLQVFIYDRPEDPRAVVEEKVEQEEVAEETTKAE